MRSRTQLSDLLQLLPFVFGGVLLITLMATAQMIAALGITPTVSQYTIPIIVGMISGATVGLIFQRLKRRDRELKQFFDLSIDMLCIADTEGRFLRLNPSFETILGWPLEEMLAKPFVDFIHPDDVNATLAEVAKLEEGISSIHFENRYCCPDGTYKWLDWTAHPTPEGLIYAVAHDITAYKEMEESLGDSTKRLSAIINTVVDGIITIDERGMIETVNPATEEIFGYAANEVVGHNVSMLMPSPYHDEHDGYLKHYRDTGERKIIGMGREVEGLRNDGTVFPLELAVSETYVGERRFFTGIIRDITKRRLAETALQESDNSNRAIVEAIPDALMRYHYNGTLLQYKAPKDHTPISPQNRLIGSKLHEHVDAELAELVLAQIQHTISIQEPWSFEYETHIDGESRTREARMVPASKHEVIAVVRDITERVKAEELLEQRVQERTLQLERRRQVSDNLRSILHVLNTYHSADGLFSHIATQSDALFDAQAMLIYEFQIESNDIQLEHFYGIEAADAVKRLSLKDDSIVCQSVRQRELLTAPNLEQYQADYGDELSAMLIKSGFAAALTVPLYIREHIFGALVFCYRDEQKFSDEELDLALTFGYQAALAIENAEFRRQLEESAIGEERNRIARDLHDSVTQTLFSTSMIADVLPLIWENDPDAGLSRLHELRELARGALAEMRTLLLELRSTAIVDAELDQLLQQLADATIGRARIPVEVQTTGDVNMLLAESRVAIYRIVQEALNNASKHSGASRITVSLDASRSTGFEGDPPDRFQLLVADDGSGFSQADRKGGHFGLSNMEERAEMVGATFSIESSPDQGTTIQVAYLKVQN